MSSAHTRKNVCSKYGLDNNSEIDDGYLFELKADLPEDIITLKAVVEEIGGKYFLSEKIESNSVVFNLQAADLGCFDDVFTGSRIREIWDSIHSAQYNFKSSDSISYSFKNREIGFSKPVVMGILNVTPDSFSDGGKFFRVDEAVKHAIEMISDGADIIDIGGESSRPSAESVSADEELDRILPVFQKLKAEKPDTIISIDTTKAPVAEKMLDYGADIINDISGLTFDARIADAVSKHNAALIIMHMQGTPKTMQVNPQYEDVTLEIFEFLHQQTLLAGKRGVKKIIVDPGIGFGKSVEDNYTIINRLEEFTCLGFPLLIGLSRKSFLGNSLDLNVDQRDNITVCAETIAMKNGARIIRTHNVKKAAEASKVFQFVNNPDSFEHV